MEQQLSATLKKMRTTCKLSQGEVGTVLGIDQAGVSRIENGTQQISVEGLIKLSRHYDIDIDYIISGHINYWALAERFGIKPKLPRRYQKDEESIVREVLPLILYYRNRCGEPYLSMLLSSFKLEQLPFLDPDQKISLLCYYDLLNHALEKDLLTSEEAGLLATRAGTKEVHGLFFNTYKGMDNSLNIAQSWVLNSHHYEGLFNHRILDFNKGRMDIEIQLNPNVKKINLSNNNAADFLAEYKKKYIEQLPLAFGLDPLQVRIEENLLSKRAKRGIFSVEQAILHAV